MRTNLDRPFIDRYLFEVHVRRRLKYPLVLAAILLALVGVRLALPDIVKHFVNRELTALQGYDGNVEDIDLAIWRGAYRISGLTIAKEGGDPEAPFVNAEAIDLAFGWDHLFEGALVGSAVITRPVINMIQAERKEETQLGEDVDWFERLQALFPFRFDTIEINQGTATFRAPGIAKGDALVADSLEVDITNLNNVAKSDEEAFAEVRAAATVLHQAPARIEGRINPTAPAPTFDVNFTLERVELIRVNPWLKTYVGVDAEAGSFQMYAEVAAKDGKFKGYVKPLMQDINILTSEEEEPNPLRRLWEGLVEFVAEIFENQQEEQVASVIPVSGSFKDLDTSVLSAIVGVLRNAFVGAFSRSLENTISLGSVGGGDLGDEEQRDAAGGKDRKDKETDPSDSGENERKNPINRRFGPRS